MDGKPPAVPPGRGGGVRGLLNDPRHGPLPAVLLLLTVLTGMVDAVSILTLGRVFVANMTGNVVFLGFAVAGATGFGVAASLAALTGFLVGGWASRLFTRGQGPDRAVLLRNTLLVELALVALAAATAAAVRQPFGPWWSAVVAIILAVGLGLQNAVARRLAVPDLTTTVLTMTLTGLAADTRSGSASWTRRVLAVVTMALGATTGALLVGGVGPAPALVACVALLAGCAAVMVSLSRRPGAWKAYPQG